MRQDFNESLSGFESFHSKETSFNEITRDRERERERGIEGRQLRNEYRILILPR